MLSRLNFKTPFLAVCFVCILLLVYIAIKESSTMAQNSTTNTIYTTNILTNIKTVKVSITNTNGQEIWYYFWQTNWIDITTFLTNATYITNHNNKKIQAAFYGGQNGVGGSIGWNVNESLSVGIGYYNNIFVYCQVNF